MKNNLIIKWDSSLDEEEVGEKEAAYSLNKFTCKRYICGDIRI
jgi:hypothetical protein